MTREQLILYGFIILVTLVFIVVLTKGIHSKQHFYRGIGALVILSVAAIGLHRFHADSGSISELTNGSISLPEIGLGVVLIGLACLGCMCADQRGQDRDR